MLGQRPFPDLKGQAPLRLSTVPEVRWFAYLFLTSKVRLHCDKTILRHIARIYSFFS